MHTSVRCAEERTVDVKFCLVFPREALSVPVARHVLGDTLRSLGADDQGVADLLLAVTEACTNVVRHGGPRSEEHTSELQSQSNLVCRLLLEKKKRTISPVC